MKTNMQIPADLSRTLVAFQMTRDGTVLSELALAMFYVLHEIDPKLALASGQAVTREMAAKSCLLFFAMAALTAKEEQWDEMTINALQRIASPVFIHLQLSEEECEAVIKLVEIIAEQKGHLDVVAREMFDGINSDFRTVVKDYNLRHREATNNRATIKGETDNVHHH